jgi:nucleoside-diphosphate-sugar epimerase
MRILVTGEMKFVGSHTSDRLAEFGHDVVVLDALIALVHRDGRPGYLTPGADLYVGDVRNRESATRIGPAGGVVVGRIAMSPSMRQQLEDEFLLFFAGLARSATSGGRGQVPTVPHQIER